MSGLAADRGGVLITGAAARVGAALARALAADGWAVAVHYNRSAGPAEALCAEIAAAGGRATPVAADLLDEAAVTALVPAAAAALGCPLTALVNNASTFERDEIETMTRASWDLHLEANLRAPLVLAQAFAAQIPADTPPGAAVILNLIDQRVKKPTPQFFSYSLSKAGLAWATVTLAQSLAPRIRVNAILPGPTLQNVRQDDDSWRRQVEATLLETGSPPEEIVRAARYLFDARAVTGALLTVDGGQHLSWKTPDVWGILE